MAVVRNNLELLKEDLRILITNTLNLIGEGSLFEIVKTDFPSVVFSKVNVANEKYIVKVIRVNITRDFVAFNIALPEEENYVNYTVYDVYTETST